MNIFYAEFRYGRPNLTKFKVDKETIKTFFVGESESIIGFRKWARRLHKDDYHVFLEATDAVKYLISRVAKHHNYLLETLEENVDNGLMLQDLLEELQKDFIGNEEELQKDFNGNENNGHGE